MPAHTYQPRMSEKATKEMLVTYHELNGDIDVLHECPSPLKFMRYVAKNRPFIVRAGCSAWPAVQRWNISHMRVTLKDTPIKVAITPYGLVHTIDDLSDLVSIAGELRRFEAMPIQW